MSLQTGEHFSWLERARFQQCVLLDQSIPCLLYAWVDTQNNRHGLSSSVCFGKQNLGWLSHRCAWAAPSACFVCVHS